MTPRDLEALEELQTRDAARAERERVEGLARLAAWKEQQAQEKAEMEAVRVSAQKQVAKLKRKRKSEGKGQ
jgi:hypothetical protein